MLKLREVSVAYGPIRAVTNVSLELPVGLVGTIIGANGAGKSSLLKAISGIVPLTSGQISIGEQRLDLIPPHRRRDSGVVHVLEGHRVFGDQSVEANLQLGALRCCHGGRDRHATAAALEAQYQRFAVLRTKRWQLAGTLSGGQQQMLAIAMALVARPSYLLLDEPSLGLAPKLVDEVFELIAALRAERLTILLIEQRALRALENSDVGWVMQRGAIVASGPSRSLLGQPKLRKAYLFGATGREAELSVPPND
jgi:branched-chain amino acid transport system ATP-binding protein